MGKKMLWAIIALGVAFFFIFVVPRMIENKKREKAEQDAKRQEYVNKKSSEMADKESNDNGPDWGWSNTEKAEDRYDKANKRSSDFVDKHGL